MKPAIKPTELDMPNEVEELSLGIECGSQPKDDDDDGSIDKNCMIGRDANHTQIVAGARAVEERRRNHP
jgi:hypothetical protein